MRHTLIRALCLAAALLSGTSAMAQQDTATRYPAEGLAILDCTPPAPAPQGSCTLRIPPRYGYEAPKSEPIGDGEAEFRLLRPSRPGFPDTLSLSATLLLVDLSPGPNGGRRATFDQEKALLARFVAGLPGTEAVAIYGFNESFTRITEFTTDRAALAAAIDGLELQGTNTRIATFVRDAVSVLADESDVLLKNLVLVSDGQEEGQQSLDQVTAAAVEAGVSISALGTFWRPVGSAQTGRGMDYLRDLTEDTLGIAGQVPLRSPERARTALDDVSAAYSEALRSSALIMPSGEPGPATISMTLSAPVLGSPGQARDTEVSVSYMPQTDAPPDEDRAEVPATIFGLPALWVYIAAGALAALVLLGLVLALGRRSRDAPEPDDELAFEEPVAEGPPTAAPPPPARSAVAYLVFDDGGRRAAISERRVSIGRSGSNEIVIEDESISRLHAQLYRNREGGFSVTDMDSLNGTRINEERVKGTSQVRLGDAITFGKVRTKLISA